MAILASAARRRPALGRPALLALTFALLLGGWLLLAPPSVDAQNMNYYGRWYAKVGGTAICPAQNDVEANAGTYSRTSANAITLNFRDWGMPNCGPDTVVQYGNSAWYRGKWYLELRTLPGSDGQLISGSHIGLPDGFTDRRTSGRLNRRDHTADGHWPHSNDYLVGVLPVTISFTIPASHGGPAYLHAGIYFNEQDENWDVWEDFSFKFDPIEPPSAAAAPRACVGPLERTANVLDSGYDSRDAQDRPVRYSMVQVTAIYDCNGELYTSRTQYGAPVGKIPANISRPRTPHCSEIKTGLSWDYDRDGDGNLLAAQETWGPSYNFRVRWTGNDCGRVPPARGSVGGGTYCGGGVLSQTPTILERAISADNTRIVYYVQLVQRLSGPDSLCPFEISNRFRTYDLPPTIPAP